MMYEAKALDPVRYGEIPLVRNTKGTPSAKGEGMNLEFNKMPPGMYICDQVTAMDCQRISKLMPTGPILK